MAKEYGYLDAADATYTTGGDRARLHRVIVGTAAASAVVTVYNGSSTSGSVVATIDASAAKDLDFGGLEFPAGLFVKLTAGAAKVTVVSA